MERPEVFAEAGEGVDFGVTEADVLAALERATRESGLRVRKAGEFDALQWQAHLEQQGLRIGIRSVERRLRAMVKSEALESAIVYDMERHLQMRVYWWKKAGLAG